MFCRYCFSENANLQKGDFRDDKDQCETKVTNVSVTIYSPMSLWSFKSLVSLFQELSP